MFVLVTRYTGEPEPICFEVTEGETGIPVFDSLRHAEEFAKAYQQLLGPDLEVLEVGVLQTVLSVLDQVLLLFIFVELLDTIGIVAREHEIVAEPFLLVGLIAVVRRILSVTAEAGQNIGTEKFQSLTIELGVLAVLVIALTVAVYVTRRTRRRERSGEDS